VHSYSTAVTDALNAVSEDDFVRRPDGALVAQSSSQRVIATMIDLLDVQAGMTVLEVGTGSGYSTALLAHLVGPTGRVVSVDVVAELVDRAQHLLPARGFRNVTPLHADGAHGAPEHGPFDRIIAWATAPHLPAAWITQCFFTGVIIAPIALAPISKSGVGARIHLANDTAPVIDEIFPAGFVELHGLELDQWLVPPYGVDVLCRDDNLEPYWLSSTWLRTPETYLQGQDIVRKLAASGDEIPGPLEDGEAAADFRAWLLATQPAGLTTAALGSPQWRIGYTGPTSAALTDMRTATSTATAGSDAAAHVLAGWATTWRQAGRPGISRLSAQLEPFYDGWILRAASS
jgi:protein-L-isoaspartate(D-aspartate) O-methyltransferase